MAGKKKKTSKHRRAATKAAHNPPHNRRVTRKRASNPPARKRRVTRKRRAANPPPLKAMVGPVVRGLVGGAAALGLTELARSALRSSVTSSDMVDRIVSIAAPLVVAGAAFVFGQPAAAMGAGGIAGGQLVGMLLDATGAKAPVSVPAPSNPVMQAIADKSAKSPAQNPPVSLAQRRALAASVIGRPIMGPSPLRAFAS